jgi:type II secretory pathway pseudopilin PulG
MIRKPRGGAMLASLIVIGVIALLTVATLQLANISKEQASKDARSLSQSACVEAARQYVLGRLRLFGAPATSIVLDQAIVVGTGTTGLSGSEPKKKMRTGHVKGPAITSVSLVRGAAMSQRTTRETSNVLGPGTLPGAGNYTAVVACTDPQARDMELEFTFQFGQ